METLLVELECRRCRTSFTLCRACFCGQAYCKTECRRQARQAQEARARAAYEESLGEEERRADARERQRRSRARRRAEGVTDQTAAKAPKPVAKEETKPAGAPPAPASKEVSDAEAVDSDEPGVQRTVESAATGYGGLVGALRTVRRACCQRCGAVGRVVAVAPARSRFSFRRSGWERRPA